MENIKVVAFDCDGVMFDTNNANSAYYNHLLTRFGKPRLTNEQFYYVHMHTADESVEYLFGEEAEEVKDYCKTLTYKMFFPYMEIEPNLKQVLETLRKKYKTAIATNRTSSMGSVLSEFSLTSFFDLVVTALDVERPKPYPDPLIKILEHFNIESNQLIYIGDSQLDEESSHSAGVNFVAYNNLDLSADFHIKSLIELLNFL
ncbi:MAG: HAD hydrolase-like protein [Desulfobacterales bacterium]|nr:HAD hydrolase-like protein [Desulfobacterales bacterium]MBF0398051.1 HAD hydrolase-like protein [Desulfobacterales bacterium]